MRIYNFNTSPQKPVLLLRHGRDESILRSDLNPGLDLEYVDDVYELAYDVVSLCQKMNKKSIYLFTSKRRRALETTEILVNILIKEGISVLGVEKRSELREICHGYFLIKNYNNNGLYQPLVDAWRLWALDLKETEIDYRFGDPVYKGKFVYGSLSVFTQYGENHREFSVRLYSFLSEFFEFVENKDFLPIILAHQATVSRIQRISNFFLKNRKVIQGKFVRGLEKTGERITIDEAHGVLICGLARKKIISALRKELKYLNFT